MTFIHSYSICRFVNKKLVEITRLPLRQANTAWLKKICDYKSSH